MTHVHWPKKGMGGNNPKSEIVALACPECHDKLDNYGGTVHTKVLPRRGLTLWATDVHGNVLFERVIEAESAAEGETLHGADNVAGSPVPPSAAPSVSAEETGVPGNAKPSSLATRPGAPEHMDAAERSVRETDDPTDLVRSQDSAAASSLLEDWTGLSDENLELKFRTADKMQGMAFLFKCKAIHAYRANHVRQWGESWVDQAIERFGVSRPTCCAYANIWELVSESETSFEDVAPLTDSHALMQYIGRKKLEDGKEAMEAAVSHFAEYAQPPSVNALAEKLGEEREPKLWMYRCPGCGQEGELSDFREAR